MYAVILSGGVGSRLWPISRKNHPKPFIKLADGLSILQHTFSRVLNIGVNGIVNITGKEILFEVKHEYQELVKNFGYLLESEYILEPCGKGTAAAIALSTLWIAEKYGEDAMLLVLPSDHFICGQKAFEILVKKASFLASEGKIVLFGIKPTAYETGYGYIRFAGNNVKCFVEKPSFAKAKEYVDAGDYLWNSGMFCFKASTMLQEMELYCPDILQQVKLSFMAAQVESKATLMNVEPEAFAKVREDTIDYAIMERSQKTVVLPCDIGWSDIGTWDAIGKLSPSDANGNVIKADVIVNQTTNCYIESQNNSKLISALGVDNLVIVDTPDALLVAHKDSAQNVKDIYNKLAQLNHPTHELHQTIYRSWGSYTILEEGIGYKIRRVVVNPKESLSLQLHRYRSEHWVVVAGKANVTNGDDSLLLHINQSTYIPAGNKHRLTNLTDEILIIIEVQTGVNLIEDDIESYEV